METLSRNPLMNDLTFNPADTAVLHESSQFSQSVKSSNGGLKFAFEWMLAIPALIDRFQTQDVTEPTVLHNQQLPYYKTFPLSTYLQEFDLTWNSIPFCWASWCRRQIQVSYVAVKAGQPARFQVDFRLRNSFDSRPPDNLGRRNYTRDVDFSLNKTQVIGVNGVYPLAYKPSSTIVTPSETTGGLRTGLNVDGSTYVDGEISFSQILPIQRGLIYPDDFAVFVFLSYVGSKLVTIVSPSSAGQIRSTSQIVSRFTRGDMSKSLIPTLAITWTNTT